MLLRWSGSTAWIAIAARRESAAVHGVTAGKLNTIDRWRNSHTGTILSFPTHFIIDLLQKAWEEAPMAQRNQPVEKPLRINPC
jgi:hypothetical protein